MHLQVITKAKRKREKELGKNLENLCVTFNENQTEINKQNIDVNETEINNLRDEKNKELNIRAKAEWQVEREKEYKLCL